MADKKLKNYEMMVALKPLLPDDLRKELHKEFVDMVQDDGGEVLDVDVWGKRYLAYKINGHNEGYYIIYNFKVSPGKIAEIKRQMQLKQEILRFMVVEIENVDKIGTGIKKKELEI
ncbi:MAG TPA: 30S ribosomal protein S6 [Candidatus Dojkabacteria bacterium]|mgnify:CR=1 FL=1|jgi:small subunit ribosomal protein S6|nr:30S ribosomal protein S6 [Candidatus Dojkabacteria bacterium]